MFEFKLPDIGEGVVEGEIVRWLVKEGEAIAEDQPMVEVMTDKATVEIPSPKRGRVSKLLWDVGAKVPVGASMIVIETTDASAPASTPVASARSVSKPASSIPASPSRDRATPKADAEPRSPVLATPAVRQYARERGVELSAVMATGPGGRATREDIERALSSRRPTLEAPAVRPSASVPSPEAARRLVSTAQDERIPFVGVRRKIAENMARSMHTAAHFTYVEECDVTDLARLRERAKANFAERGVRLSFLPFVVKAVVAGLRKVPILNAMLDEAKGEIVLRKSYHIGVAAATDQGLIVPVIRDADRKSIVDLARDLQDLGDRAKSGKLTPSDVGGSTFTITSLGDLGGVLATPIINFPEVAILGVHRIRKRPVVLDGQIVIRDMVNLSVSLDHRVVDGYDGAQFLSHVTQTLQDPVSLIEIR